jgi:hypothetical protein
VLTQSVADVETSSLWSRHCSPPGRFSHRVIFRGRRRHDGDEEHCFAKSASHLTRAVEVNRATPGLLVVSRPQNHRLLYIYRLVSHHHLGSVFVCVRGRVQYWHMCISSFPFLNCTPTFLLTSSIVRTNASTYERIQWLWLPLPQGRVKKRATK